MATQGNKYQSSEKLCKTGKTTSSGSFQQYFSTKHFSHLGCVSLRKSNIGFLNPKESENGFCVSLLSTSIQVLSIQLNSIHFFPLDVVTDP